MPDLRLLAIADHAPVHLAQVDAEGNYIFANTSYAELFDRDPAEMVGMSVEQVLGAGYQNAKAYIDSALRGEDVTYELALDLNGAQVRLKAHYAPEFNPDGSVRGFLAAIIDVTAIHEAIRERELARLLLVETMNGAGIYLARLKPDGSIDYVNRIACEDAALTEQDLKGLPFDEGPWWSWSADVQGQIREMVARAAAGEPSRDDVLMRSYDGSVNWMDTRICPIYENDKIIALTASGTDITARRKAEDQARSSKERLQMALTAGKAIGSWKLDLEKNILWFDETFAATFDLPEKIDGRAAAMKAVWNIIYPDDRRRIIRRLNASIQSGAVFDEDYRLILADGRVIWALARGECAYNCDKVCTHFSGILLDIDSRKVAERHRALLIDELNHRVKNTLAVVQGIARQTFPRKSSEAKIFSQRLATLAGAHKILTRSAWEDADLRDIIETSLAVSQFGRQRLNVDNPPVKVDSTAAVSIALAFHELCTNAIKYGALSNDTGMVDISWKIFRDTNQLVITWQETGGPPPAPDATTTSGFGMRMIETVLAEDIRGSVHVDFRPAGLEVNIQLPMTLIEARLAQ